MSNSLGEKMMTATFAVKGKMNTLFCKGITESIINKIQMQVAYPEKIYTYPYKNKGGVGYTYFQTITESFIAWDVWPGYQGAYLVICSCKEFDIEDVSRVLAGCGLIVIGKNQSRLSLC